MADRQPFSEVAGKVAVVTGAARGLGQGTAETLAAHGVHVVAADILPAVHETIDGIRAAHPDNRGYAQETDVSDEGAVRDLVEGAVKELGRLDIMVNNAGMHLSEGPVADMDVDVIDRIFAVNFKGIFFGCKHAARQMREQKGGTIVNLGSYGGKLGFPEYAAYCSSKGAVHTLTISLAREMARLPRHRQCALSGAGRHGDALELHAGRGRQPRHDLRRVEDRGAREHTPGPLRGRPGHGGHHHVAGLRRRLLRHRPVVESQRRPLFRLIVRIPEEAVA